MRNEISSISNKMDTHVTLCLRQEWVKQKILLVVMVVDIPTTRRWTLVEACSKGISIQDTRDEKACSQSIDSLQRHIYVHGWIIHTSNLNFGS